MKNKLGKVALVSLYVAAFFGLFWWIWSAFAPIPALTETKWPNGSVWHLPFAISRLWDVLFAPLCVIASFAFYFFSKSLWLDNLLDIIDEKIGTETTGSLIFGLAILLLFYGTISSLVLSKLCTALFFFFALASVLSVILIFILITILIWLFRLFIKFNKRVFGSDSK